MIKVSGITKTFDGNTALENLSCEIPEGKIFGLVGSNGAGKSTLLRILTGIYEPDKGEVSYDGEPVFDNPAVKEQMVLVSDEIYFLPGANLKRMAKFYKNFYPSFSMDRFDRLTTVLKLDTRKRLSGFSKGMRRQAATVLALACCPKYYFFDETFDGLDQIVRDTVKKLIYEDICERGVTAILTSHSLRELDNTCDELALLHEGKLVFSHEVETIKTTARKFQVVFETPLDAEEFMQLCGVKCLSVHAEGRVIQAIISEGAEQAEANIRERNPVMLEILPLTLEEIFSYEMESLGYSFDAESEGEDNENKNQ
ncbi:MAG: ABC transporter ATP-binding protein [Lachnospiraceae bacterium]|nr:ABC transporter ATP-binding protein [Lachnospiraceae bacterium]